MANVLCIDTEPETVLAIGRAGHAASVGNLGYRTGVIHQPYDPSDFDAIVIDLRRPACRMLEFADVTGAVGASSDTVFAPHEAYRRWRGKLVPTFKLIERAQMLRESAQSFGGKAILDAVKSTDIQVFLFLNAEWIRHLCLEFPDWLPLAWHFQPAVIDKIVWSKRIARLVPELLDLKGLRHSVRFSIAFGPVSSTMNEAAWRFADRLPVYVPRMLAGSPAGRCVGQVIRPDRRSHGKIWAFPALPDSASLIGAFLDRLNKLKNDDYAFGAGFGKDGMSRAF